MYERFRAGVRAWIDAMPAPPVEYVLLDAAPDIPDDDASWASCWAMFSWGLSGNWDLELLRVHLTAELGEEAAGRLVPPLVGAPTAPAAGRLAADLLGSLPRSPRGQGSNEWAIAGSRTASGKPLLANDPHLLVRQPGAWLELHLRAPGYEARGVTAPFSPGIILGTTAHHAWGATNVSGDVQDLYLERLDDDASAARYGGAWEPLTVFREEIHVRGTEAPIVHEVRASRHGRYSTRTSPATSGPSTTPSTRRTHSDGSARSTASGPRSSSTSPTSRASRRSREAARALECPGQNLVYADVDGTIGYQCTGLHPIRRAGDGTVPVPGWTDEYEWDGFVPFEELPWAVDPERGFLVTANDRVQPEDAAHPLGQDFHAPDRAARITALLDERRDHSVETCRTIQVDTTSLAAKRLVPAIAIGDGPGAELLRTWDGDVAADSAGAALWEVVVDELGRRAVGGKEPLVAEYLTERDLFRCRALPRPPRDGALSEGGSPRRSRPRGTAASRRWATTRRRGDGGEIHRARFTHPLGRLPGLEPLFVAAELPLGGDEQTVGNAGFEGDGPFDVAVVPSWRAVYDLADLDASRGALPTGQSGNPASPHWNDQTELWAAGDLRPLPFTRPAVEAAATARLDLRPA